MFLVTVNNMLSFKFSHFNFPGCYVFFYQGFRLGNIQKFAHDILVALNFLAQPQVDVIHCDLKPENVLLCSHDNRRWANLHCCYCEACVIFLSTPLNNIICPSAVM